MKLLVITIMLAIGIYTSVDIVFNTVTEIKDKEVLVSTCEFGCTPYVTCMPCRYINGWCAIRGKNL